MASCVIFCTVHCVIFCTVYAQKPSNVEDRTAVEANGTKTTQTRRGAGSYFTVQYTVLHADGHVRKFLRSRLKIKLKYSTSTQCCSAQPPNHSAFLAHHFSSQQQLNQTTARPQSIDIGLSVWNTLQRHTDPKPSPYTMLSVCPYAFMNWQHDTFS